MPAETLDILVKMKDFATAELKRLNATIDNTAKKGKAGFDLFGAAAQSLQGHIMGLGGSVAAYFSARAIINAIQGTADWADNMEELGQQVGVSTEALSEFEYIARQNGATLEDLEAGFRLAQKGLAEFIETGQGPAARVFHYLSGDTQMLVREGTKLEDLLPRISRDLKMLGDADRVLVASQLFGRGGAKLLPMLISDLEEGRDRARELGVTLGSDNAAAAGQYKDAVDDLLQSLGAMKREMVFGILPLLTEVANVMTKASQAARSLSEARWWTTAQGPYRQSALRGWVRDQLDQLKAKDADDASLWQGPPNPYATGNPEADAKAIQSLRQRQSIEDQIAQRYEQRAIQAVRDRQDAHAASLQAQADQEAEIANYREAHDFMAGAGKKLRELQAESQRFGDVAGRAIEGVGAALSYGIVDVLIQAQQEGANLREVLTAIGFDIQRIFLNEAISLGVKAAFGGIGSLLGIPSMQVGGPVLSTGLHYLHAGEQVLPPSEAREYRGGGGTPVALSINVAVSGQDVRGTPSDIDRRGRSLGIAIASEIRQSRVLQQAIREAAR